MCKKNLISVILFIFLFFLAENCFSDVSADLDKAKSDAVSLIESGKYAEAQQNIQQLIAKFSANQNLPEVLCWIAQKYGWAEKHEQEKALYQIILQEYPSSPYASRANLGLEKANIQSLVMSHNFEDADAALQKLISDFSGSPDLPEALYWIAERYEWSYGYNQANNVRQLILQKYPSSSFVYKTKFSIARANVLSLIVSERYEDARAALGKLIDDFSRNPDLSETLYWIAQKYGWSGKHEEEKSIYQKILQEYPYNSYAGKAKLGLAKANVQSLIMSENYDGANAALAKLISDFSGNPDLPESLYWIAERCEWSGRYKQAKSIHAFIIRSYPDNQFADKAKLGVVRVNISSLIMSQNFKGAFAVLDKMFDDFSDNPDLPRTILILGEQCYTRGVSKNKQGLDSEAEQCFGKAAEIWSKFINGMPASPLTPEICCRAGDCYFKIAKYKESLKCFQKAVDNSPGYEYAGHAQFMVGRCYEKLKINGDVDALLADEQTEIAYEKVVENYPKSQSYEYANHWLAKRN